MPQKRLLNLRAKHLTTNKMKFAFLFLFLLFISSASAYTIICTEGERGVQIWNLEQTFDESGWKLEDLENEEGMNCSLIEFSVTLENCKEYEPIIDQLNQRLEDNYVEIQTLEKSQGIYKVFSIIFAVVLIILVIFMRANRKK